MAKGAKSTALALNVNSEVPEVLSLLDAELKSLKQITDKPYKTTGNLDMGGNTMDIKTEQKVVNLIRAFSSVNGREKAYTEAAQALELKEWPAFEVSGGSAEDWRQDIQTRLAVIQYEDRKNKLQGFQDQMKKFLSESDQKAILLKEMAAFLKK
jgi:hypothetical protein